MCKNANVTCGHLLNNCGNSISCGTCKLPKTCHQPEGRCLCIPVRILKFKTVWLRVNSCNFVLIRTMYALLQESNEQIAEKCKAANLTCGHVINKCGKKITCGKCKWPKQCHDGKCFCIPVSQRLHWKHTCSNYDMLSCGFDVMPWWLTFCASVPLKTFPNICDRILRRKRVVQPLISPVESSRTIVERHWTVVPVRPSRNALMDTVSELERNDLRFHFTLHSYWKVGNYSHVHQALNFEWPLKFETTV